MTRTRICWLLCTVVSLTALALSPASAVATPPVLTSVVVPLNGNHPTSTWTLPAGVTSQFIQVSHSSEVNADGYFTSLETFNPLAKTQTTLVDDFDYENGVYYLHVAGHDQRCRGGSTGCQPIEFSQVMSFQVPGIGGGPGGSLPDTGGGPGADKIRPFQTLTFAPVQDIDKLFVRARMSEAGTLRATARVSVPGASKVYKFKTASRSVRANKFTKLSLKLARKPLQAVKRSLRRKNKLKARVTVTATDKAGNKRSQKATIGLKP